MTIWRRVACCICNAIGVQADVLARAHTPTQQNTNTNTQKYTIPIKWFRERASMLRYTTLSLLFHYFFLSLTLQVIKYPKVNIVNKQKYNSEFLFLVDLYFPLKILEASQIHITYNGTNFQLQFYRNKFYHPLHNLCCV
jgi:hypothetical protein